MIEHPATLKAINDIRMAEMRQEAQRYHQIARLRATQPTDTKDRRILTLTQLVTRLGRFRVTRQRIERPLANEPQ